MRGKNADLHGNAPDTSPVALLIIDMISDMAFDGAEALLPRALPVAERIARLKARARQADVPVVYVNDNHGKWRSDFRQQVDHVLAGSPGAAITRLLGPDEDDYFVLKPKHSGFYCTTLGLLLDYLGVRTLVLTGLRTDSCVLFTANDAFLREFAVVVPTDGTVTFEQADHDATLALMARELKAEVLEAEAIDFEALKARRKSG